ncbi:MAG: helix-turn-helix transcriptional regulator [Oscillochloris sp.]|nr:helix-turn-helix transcriptional regulator [Oscillochloris sp.]
MGMLHEQSRMVGQRVATARQHAGLSIRDLADRIGWPRDTLVNYELGRRAITIERLEAIADALGIPAAALLIENDQLAALLNQLSANPGLLSYVHGFIDTLETGSVAGLHSETGP